MNDNQIGAKLQEIVNGPARSNRRARSDVGRQRERQRERRDGREPGEVYRVGNGGVLPPDARRAGGAAAEDPRGTSAAAEHDSKRARSHFEMEAGNLVHREEELEQHNFELSTKLSDAHNETILSLAAHNEKESVVEDLRRRLHDAKALLLGKESHVSELSYSHDLLQAENTDTLLRLI